MVRAFSTALLIRKMEFMIRKTQFSFALTILTVALAGCSAQPEKYELPSTVEPMTAIETQPTIDVCEIECAKYGGLKKSYCKGKCRKRVRKSKQKTD